MLYLYSAVIRGSFVFMKKKYIKLMNQYFKSVDKPIDFEWYFEQGQLSDFEHLQELEDALNFLEKERHIERSNYNDYLVFPTAKGMVSVKKNVVIQYSQVLKSILRKIKLDSILTMIVKLCTILTWTLSKIKP